MFLLELALILPVVILGGTSLIDTVSVLRSQNALKEAAQASLRCLTTINSPCTLPQEHPPATRQFTYYRVTNPPTIYGNLKRVPANVDERVAPLQRYQFDATVLNTAYSATAQQRYQEMNYQYSSVADVSYVRERFPFFVDYDGSSQTHRVIKSASDPTPVGPSEEIKPSGGPVKPGSPVSLTFKIPRPGTLSGFGSNSLCVTRPIRDGQATPPTCYLSMKEIGNASYLHTTAMLLMEGTASGGSASSNENAQVTMEVSYSLNKTTITTDLGGQQFPLNGQSHREDFVPRGAPAGDDFAARYPTERVDTGSPYYDGEITKYASQVISFPFDTPITLTLTFVGGKESPNASWQPQRLAIYLPSFEQRETTLSCTNSPSCAKLSSSTSSCLTTPALKKGITAVRPTARTSSSPANDATACLASPPLPSPTDSRFRTYTLGGISCVDAALEPIGSATCPPLISSYQCDGANKGIAIQPDADGYIRAASTAIVPACNAPAVSSGTTLPETIPLQPGQALATLRTVRVTTAAGTPAEAQSFPQSCDPATVASTVGRPSEVQPYHQVTPIQVGTVPGKLQSLPAELASVERSALACFPTRSVDAVRASRLLGDYGYLTAPHPDRGCGYSGLLKEAETTVERDARYDVTFGSPQTTPLRFAFEDGSKPDACQQFTVGTPEIARERLELIGTFPESNPPAECGSSRCVREFAGLLGSASPTGPSVDVARAVAEAKAAYHAYLPNREPDDLNVVITPPTGTGDNADTFRVSTELSVPLSFDRQSLITHVAHGKPEVDGD